MKIQITGKELRQALYEWIIKQGKIAFNNHCVGAVYFNQDDSFIDDSATVSIDIESIFEEEGSHAD